MPLQSAVASSRQRQARAAAASRHDQTLFVQILKINCTNRSHFPNHMSAIFFLLFVTYLHKNRATWPCSSSPSHLQVIGLLQSSSTDNDLYSITDSHTLSIASVEQHSTDCCIQQCLRQSSHQHHPAPPVCLLPLLGRELGLGLGLGAVDAWHLLKTR